MLADPLVIRSLNLTAITAVTTLDSNSYALIDAGSGRSVRKDPSPLLGGQALASSAVLSISHSVSKENGAMPTDRSLIRLDYPLVGEEGQAITAFCYAVIGVPRGPAYNAAGGDVYLNSDLGIFLAQSLIGVLGVSNTSDSLDSTTLARILAGES